MNLSAGVSLGQLLLTVAATLLAGGIAWGSLLQRVRTLEREVEVLSGFAERLTRIEEQTGFANRKLDAIVGSWLFKEPPAYGTEDYSPGRRPRNT